MFDEGLILLETCKISDTSKVSAESQAAEIIRIALFTLLKVWIVHYSTITDYTLIKTEPIYELVCFKFFDSV